MFSTGSCRYVSSSKSFLFSLYNINGYAPFKVNIKSSRSSYAIYTCSDRGPVFGGGHVWWIANNAGSNRDSHTYCGNSYPLPPGYSASGASCQFYAGSYKFTPTDVEVFYLNNEFFNSYDEIDTGKTRKKRKTILTLVYTHTSVILNQKLS